MNVCYGGRLVLFIVVCGDTNHGYGRLASFSGINVFFADS
jgi:hypothetical protein